MAGHGQLEVVWFKSDLRVADHAPLAEARPNRVKHGVRPYLGLGCN